jgi:predicted Zn-dependent peptidase
LKVKKERKKERNQKQLLQNDATLLLKKKKKKKIFFFFFFQLSHIELDAIYYFFFFFKIYKSSRTRSSLRVTRDLEAVSNDASAEATRDFVLYRATTSRESAGSALSQLVDITAPALRHWEIEEAHEYVDHMATRALTDAALTDDLLHAAAFRGLGAGRPLVPHRHAASVELDQLRSFVLRNFVAPRLIVVASGLDAEAAVSIAKAATANVPKGVAAPAPAPYVGGERFLELPSGVTHFSLALSAAGISRAAAAVLVSVIGHHKSVGSWRTVGGSGRLGKVSTDALLNASAFYTGPGPSALLGFHGVTTSPTPAAKLAAARSVLETLVDPLDSQTLQGAKNRAVNELLTLYGSRNVVPFLAESVARGGSLSASALVAEIQAITAADLVAAAKKMRSTPLSVAAVGNVGGM